MNVGEGVVPCRALRVPPLPDVPGGFEERRGLLDLAELEFPVDGVDLVLEERLERVRPPGVRCLELLVVSDVVRENAEVLENLVPLLAAGLVREDGDAHQDGDEEEGERQEPSVPDGHADGNAGSRSRRGEPELARIPPGAGGVRQVEADRDGLEAPVHHGVGEARHPDEVCGEDLPVRGCGVGRDEPETGEVLAGRQDEGARGMVVSRGLDGNIGGMDDDALGDRTGQEDEEEDSDRDRSAKRMHESSPQSAVGD
jgi:hypothetical protein